MKSVRLGSTLVCLVCLVCLASLGSFWLHLAARPAWASPAHGPAAMTASAAQPQVTITTTIWSRWQPDQYALADDGQSLWIGAAGGIVRWNKASQTYQRYGAVDGLPHQHVYAAAIDAVGNRWFVGDGGLSRLDAANQWHHYAAANSGLRSDLVDAIAVGADNALWLGHGQPAGAVSQRNPDGSWQGYPSRAAAVAADTARILHTQNVNRLWTVAGNEIWVGYAVYKDGQWLDRTPPAVPLEPVTVAADSTGTVWVLPELGTTIYKWDGTTWSMVSLAAQLPFDGSVTSLAVGAKDTVWIGWEERPGLPYTNRLAGYAQLTNLDEWHQLTRQGPVTALLPAATGVWGIGPAWLLQPDGTLTDLVDVPRFPTVTDAVVDGAGLLWLHSQRFAPYSEGVLQTVNDQGDPAMGNDVWTVKRELPLIMALERTLGSDLWLAVYLEHRVTEYMAPERLHLGDWTSVTLPNAGASGIPLTDIFAEDERHTWFAYGGAVRGVLALDDGGTIADLTDDQWRDYPIETGGTGGAVAVDGLGRLWFGDSTGLYRHDGNTWRVLGRGNPANKPIADLTPAANGVLFAKVASYGSGTTTFGADHSGQSILVVQPDGSMMPVGVDQLVQEQFDLVRSAVHRNRLWSVALDGAVWYLSPDPTGMNTLQLHRRSATELLTYPVPFAATVVDSLEIDPNNHIWLVADGALWRMTAEPDFTLALVPSLWLLAPGESRQGRVLIGSQERFTGTVALAVNGLPNGVVAQLASSQVTASQSITVGLLAAGDAPLGTYPVTLVGTSGDLVHTTPLTVLLMAAVYEVDLPVVSR